MIDEGDENSVEVNFLLNRLATERAKLADVQDQLDTLRTRLNTRLNPREWTQGPPTHDQIRTHEKSGGHWLTNDPLYPLHPCIITLKTDDEHAWIINGIVDIPERFDLCEWANRCSYYPVNNQGLP